MRTSQVIEKAKQQAANARKPYVVYLDEDRNLKVSPSQWGQAVLGIDFQLQPDTQVLGFAFPGGRFNGVYHC